MDRREFLAAGTIGFGTLVAGCSETGDGDATPGTDEESTADAVDATTAKTTTADPTTRATDGEPTDDAGGVAEVLVGPDGDFVFEPDPLRVEPGTTVRFVWESDNHNVVVDARPDDAAWEGTPGDDGDTYDAGYEFTHAFEVVGTYEYFCAPHAAAGMEASVVVDPDPSTEPVRDAYESETEIDAVADDWPRFAATPQNTGYRSTSAPREFVPAWRYAPEDETTLHPPVVADGRLYTWTDARVLALDAATGTVDWIVTDEASGWSHNAGPTVVDGVLYAGGIDGVSALDAATGDRLWRGDLGATVTSAPTVGADALFFTTNGDENGTIRALDRATGDPLWRHEVDQFALCAPGIDGSTVFVASQEAALYALNADTGAVRWRLDAVEGNTSAPAVADGTVYAVDGYGTAYAVDGASGDVRWTREVGESGVDSPIVVDGAVVGTSAVDDETGAVWRLDADSGAERWRTETNGAGYVASAAADGLAFVSVGRGVVAVDLATGRVRHERDLGVSITDPVVADGVVFVGGEEIHALAAP